MKSTSVLEPRTAKWRQHFKDIMNRDDSPYETLQLPFKFIIFGKSIDKLFINPNGILMLNKHSPCGIYNTVFGGGAPGERNGQCNLKHSYTDGIAGYLYDLNPAASTLGNVSALYEVIDNANQKGKDYFAI